MQAGLSHSEAKALFLAAVDEDLAEKEALQLRTHLDECGQCKNNWERYSRGVSRVKGVDREQAPPGLASMIVRRIRRRRFGSRNLALAHAHYRVPVEVIIPLLLGVLVAAFLVLSAP
jgi:hypothetical protein